MFGFFSSSSSSGSSSSQYNKPSGNKRRFGNTVKKGDILVTGQGVGGLVGHAAIMSTDDWVLEMVGGEGWKGGIDDNNRLISKSRWFDEHASDYTTVYRCPHSSVAELAADWAYRTYYNPTGGSNKTKHISYEISPDFRSTDPSYCSKLVVQAYYYGTQDLRSSVIIFPPLITSLVIIPTKIPTYFAPSYSLIDKGTY